MYFELIKITLSPKSLCMVALETEHLVLAPGVWCDRNTGQRLLLVSTLENGVS